MRLGKSSLGIHIRLIEPIEELPGEKLDILSLEIKGSAIFFETSTGH
jgi:hypothetical protein